jgi:hypothetical protein
MTSKVIIFSTILFAINTASINDVYDLIKRMEPVEGSEQDEKVN